MVASRLVIFTVFLLRFLDVEQQPGRRGGARRRREAVAVGAWPSVGEWVGGQVPGSLGEPLLIWQPVGRSLFIPGCHDAVHCLLCQGHSDGKWVMRDSPGGGQPELLYRWLEPSTVVSKMACILTATLFQHCKIY